MKLLDRNTFSVRYEILRSGGVVGEMQAYDAAEVRCDTESDMVLSVRGTFYPSGGTVNFFTDRLRPVVILNGEEYPLGVYVITTEERSEAGGRPIAELEGYSLLYLARRKKIETRLHIPAGTNYVTQIVDLLSLSGIADIEADPSSYTMATDREDWDIGTPVLDIVNTLLAEISYRNAYIDLAGRVQLRRYTPPTLQSAAHIYTDGRDSIITPSYKLTDDRYEKANVFRLYCDNPDMEELMVAVSENNSASSPFSTVNIGRVLHNEQVDNVPSQTALQERADAMRDKSMQTTEEIEFSTAIAPVHVPHDTVAISVGGASGIFAETGWRVSLSPDSDMTHTARRVIT